MVTGLGLRGPKYMLHKHISLGGQVSRRLAKACLEIRIRKIRR